MGTGSRRGHPRVGHRLEAADDEAADLLLEVGVAVGVAEDGQIRVDARDRVGDDVEVLGRVQRDVDPAMRRSPWPTARAVDDDLGLDVAAVGVDAGDDAAALMNPTTRMRSNIRAPSRRAPEPVRL